LLTVGAMTTLLGCSPGKSTTATSTPPVSGITLPPTPVTTSLPATQDLPSGIYVDGRQGTPHYFITLTTKQDNTLTGTLSYLYQDGHNFQVFAFTATTQAGTATITVASQPALTATYGNRTLTLDACLSYLGLAQTATQCTFQFSPNGLQ
jgi:hypothetical protein